MLHKPISKRTYVADATCAQDLARTSFAATGGRYGESVTVTACGVRGLSGTIDVSAETVEYGRLSLSGGFGRGGFGRGGVGRHGDNRRCVVGAAVVTEAGRSSSTTRAPDHPLGKRRAGGLSGAPGQTANQARGFRPIDWPGEVCPNTTTTTVQLGKLRKDTEIRVHVWSKVPSDVTGAMLRITHNVAEPNVSDETWARHVAEREARRAAERERAERERPPRSARKHTRWKTRTVRVEPQPSAPPPAAKVETRPPQPSVHAEWVPGYWHWASPNWLWIRGRWRVPEADVTDGLTVAAPYAPPPVKSEHRPPQPAVAAVWAAGYWQWNGAAFVWVPGSWRIAPGAHVRWQVPRWRTYRRGVVFVPGRWVRRR